MKAQRCYWCGGGGDVRPHVHVPGSKAARIGRCTAPLCGRCRRRTTCPRCGTPSRDIRAYAAEREQQRIEHLMHRASFGKVLGASPESIEAQLKRLTRRQSWNSKTAIREAFEKTATRLRKSRTCPTCEWPIGHNNACMCKGMTSAKPRQRGKDGRPLVRRPRKRTKANPYQRTCRLCPAKSRPSKRPRKRPTRPYICAACRRTLDRTLSGWLREYRQALDIARHRKAFWRALGPKL
jgi:hypothetical protein